MVVRSKGRNRGQFRSTMGQHKGWERSTDEKSKKINYFFSLDGSKNWGRRELNKCSIFVKWQLKQEGKQGKVWITRKMCVHNKMFFYSPSEGESLLSFSPPSSLHFASWTLHNITQHYVTLRNFTQLYATLRVFIYLLSYSCQHRGNDSWSTRQQFPAQLTFSQPI